MSSLLVDLCSSRITFSLALALTTWASRPAEAQVVTAEEPAFALLHRAVPSDPGRWAIELADLDLDGDLDAVTASGALVVYQNDGHALFSERSRFPVFVNDVKLGDLDRDGDTDVVAVTALDLVLLENDLQGGFAAREVPFVLPGPVIPVYRSQALADIDGDGDLDVLFVANAPFGFADTVWVVRNRGDASFEQPAALTSVSSTSCDLEAADLDGDGDVDLAHSGGPGPNGSLVIVFNEGGGSFAQGPTLLSEPPPVLGIYDLIELGDVDGNGTIDLVFNDRSYQSALHLFLNRGGAAFSEAMQRFPARALYAFDLELTDVNQDHTPDLLTGWNLLLNDGLGFFKDGAAALPAGYGAWRAGDLDRDGDVDFFNGGRLTLQDAHGRFHDPDLQEPYSSPAKRTSTATAIWMRSVSRTTAAACSNKWRVPFPRESARVTRTSEMIRTSETSTGTETPTPSCRIT